MIQIDLYRQPDKPQMLLRPTHPKPQLNATQPARRTPLAWAMILSLGLLLGGCASLFQYDETPDPTNNPALNQATWWNDFHDPLLAI